MTTSVPLAQALHRLDLVHVELVDARALENLRELLGKRRLEIAETRGARRDRMLVGDLPPVEILDLDLFEELGDFHEALLCAAGAALHERRADYIRIRPKGKRSRAAAS